MSDFSLEDTGIPPTEDSIPDLSILNIHSSVEEIQATVMDPLSSRNQVSLADLHQDYIDRIAKFLDPKSLVRLQLTCKALSHKGAAAQRLVEFTPRTIDYRGTGHQVGKEPNKMKFYGSLRFTILTETQFEATAFRLRAETLIINQAFTLEDCDYIDEHLRGRGTIRELQLYGTLTVDAIRFNKFMKDFHIAELTVHVMPVDYFDQPYVQKLAKLSYFGIFPLSLNFISDSSIHSGSITFRPQDFDYGDLNLLLKKWAVNEKIIKELLIGGVRRFASNHQAKAFDGWRILSRNEMIPLERPVVVRDRSYKFRVLRADGATLYITVWREKLNFSINEYHEEPYDSDDDAYLWDDYSSSIGSSDSEDDLSSHDGYSS